MSLINEALKKAQRLRSNEPAEIAPMPGGDTRVTKRGQPRTTQQLLLFASGGLVLVVLSVVITVWLINRAPADKSSAKAAAPKISAVTTPAGSAPTIVTPMIKAPVVTGETPPTKTTPPLAPGENPTTASATLAVTPSPVVAPVPAPVAPPVVTQPRAQPVVETPAPPPAAAPPPTLVATQPATAPAALADQPAAPPKTDERVHAFVDAIKVAGIRSSGGDGRVLMNDRVFRVNDIVERNLGVRLTKVEADALTFTDGNGAIYVKHF